MPSYACKSLTLYPIELGGRWKIYCGGGKVETFTRNRRWRHKALSWMLARLYARVIGGSELAQLEETECKQVTS